MVQRMEGKDRKRVVSIEKKGSAKGLSRIQEMGKNIQSQRAVCLHMCCQMLNEEVALTLGKKSGV